MNIEQWFSYLYLQDMFSTKCGSNEIFFNAIQKYDDNKTALLQEVKHPRHAENRLVCVAVVNINIQTVERQMTHALERSARLHNNSNIKKHRINITTEADTLVTASKPLT